MCKYTPYLKYIVTVSCAKVWKWTHCVKVKLKDLSMLKVSQRFNKLPTLSQHLLKMSFFNLQLSCTRTEMHVPLVIWWESSSFFCRKAFLTYRVCDDVQFLDLARWQLKSITPDQTDPISTQQTVHCESKSSTILFLHNFAKCWPIENILLLDLARSLQ